MGSLRFKGIRFYAYPMDHVPRHVHASYAELDAIIDLKADGTPFLSSRTDALRPSHGSKADLRHILDTAADNFAELVALWESNRG